MNNTETIRIYKCLSIWPLDMPWSHLITWAVATSILSPITIISNSALIYGLYKTQQLTTITNKFVLIMSISDLALGIVVLPSMVAMICLKDTFRNCKLELFVEYGSYLFGYFSFFLLICISLDRYLHVTKLNKYHQFMNGSRMKIITVICLVTAAGIAYILTFFPSFWLSLALNSISIGLLGLMCFLYSVIFRKITIHTERFKEMLEELGRNQSTNHETRAELSATKTIRIILAALFVTYMPFIIGNTLFSYYKTIDDNQPPLLIKIVTYCSYTLVLSNTAINAIIIGYGNSAVKLFLLNKLHRARPSVDAVRD